VYRPLNNVYADDNRNNDGVVNGHWSGQGGSDNGGGLHNDLIDYFNMNGRPRPSGGSMYIPSGQNPLIDPKAEKPKPKPFLDGGLHEDMEEEDKNDGAIIIVPQAEGGGQIEGGGEQKPESVPQHFPEDDEGAELIQDVGDILNEYEKVVLANKNKNLENVPGFKEEYKENIRKAYTTHKVSGETQPGRFLMNIFKDDKYKNIRMFDHDIKARNNTLHGSLPVAHSTFLNNFMLRRINMIDEGVLSPDATEVSQMRAYQHAIENALRLL
jgi:hypothetical protein